MYTVRIECDGYDWFFDCTCPFADSWSGSCKHAWATLLKADQEGLLPNGFHNDDDDAQIALPPIRPANQTAQKPPAHKEPQWRKTLAHLRNMAMDHRMPHVAEPAIFPADRRIVYLIDVPATLDRGYGLTIEVMTQKRMKNGDWDRPKASSLEVEQWLHAPDESDRMIAQLLLGAAGHEGAYFGGSQKWFNIPGSRYESILKRMCDTGRC